MSEIVMQDGRVRLFQGDCRDALRELEDNSIDSCVCDPPYALVSISKRFSKSGRTVSTESKSDAHQRFARGFMGKNWDNEETAFAAEFWAEVMRVLKPGGYVLAFGGTRTYHRLACAIEDAGFEIRDQIGWAYGSGFPKSHNQDGEWAGWGTALKPAWEPIVMARKPLDGTNAANLDKWGVGCLNIEDCRVPSDGRPLRVGDYKETADNVYEGRQDGSLMGGSKAAGETDLGRWPANLIHDGSDEVVAAFPVAPGQMAKAAIVTDRRKDQNVYGSMSRGSEPFEPRDDSGSAARFFYCAKASRADRDAGLDHLPKKAAGLADETSGQHITRRDEGYEVKPRANTHPTVKPTDLMRYLCRLVTPPGGVVLDPFMGSGSTGKAAVLEGFQFVGVEREEEYMPIASARIAWAIGQMDRPDAPKPKARKAPANDNQASLFMSEDVSETEVEAADGVAFG